MALKVRKVVLPVAGLGTRFLPATKVMPKELLPIVDKPLIQYAVEEAWAAGAEEVILVNGRGKGALEDHFDRAPELEETLRARNKIEQLQCVLGVVPPPGRIASVRQVAPLGLGHAVWCARELVGNEPFAVILPDDLVQAREPVLKQMTDRFAELQAAMVAVEEVPREQTNQYGILDPGAAIPAGELIPVKGLVEKPAPEQAPSTLAIIGRYILMPAIFERLGSHHRGAGGEIQLTDAMASLLGEAPLYGYRFQGRRFDCGSKVGFQMANFALAMERPEMRGRLRDFLRNELENQRD